MQAVQKNNYEMVIYFINKGADVNIKTNRISKIKILFKIGLQNFKKGQAYEQTA